MVRFAVTWDYRCPFARNIHEHLVAGLEAGADWDVEFVPFSLSQVHREEGDVEVWDDPLEAPGRLAVEAALAVRELAPESFLAAHLDLFAVRHDRGEDLRDPAVVERVLENQGLPVERVLAEIESGAGRELFRREHRRVVESHAVFGVPTFLLGDDAVFVRVMTRPQGDGKKARATIDKILDLVGESPELNEFKHTRVPR